MYPKYLVNQGVSRQPPTFICCTKYSDMLTPVHLISNVTCDKFSILDSDLGHNDFFMHCLVFPSILAVSFRPSHSVFPKASPLACHPYSDSTTITVAATTTIMANNKNNNNDKDKDLDQDERDRRQRVREERERRRALASMGKADLVATPPNLQNLFGHANPSAEGASSSVTATQRAPHPPPSSAAALDAAAAVPLPDDDDSDLDSDRLLASDQEADQDPLPYEDDEEGMDVDDAVPPNDDQKWNVSISREAPHEGELDVGPSRQWTPSSLKDGTKPASVREIAIQCDYGRASLARRRKYLIGARRRHDRRRREKSKADKASAREDGRLEPHPDAEASHVSPSQSAAGPSQAGSGGGSALPATSRQGEAAPPTKRARQGLPSKKKEERKTTGSSISPVRAPARQPEMQVQSTSSSGGSQAAKRQVDFHPSARTKPAPKASRNWADEAPRHHYYAPQKRHHQKSQGPRFDSNTAKMIEVFVKGMSEAFRASRGFDRSPSPQPHHSRDYRSGSRHHSYHRDDRACFEREEEEEERGRSRSRRRSRSRSQSRGRSRDRRPPPYRGKGKGRGKGRGK